MKKKIFIILLVAVLLVGAVSLTIKPVRNAFIDKMIPSVKKSDTCIYSSEDIESAISCVKERFKAKEKEIILLRIYFDEEESQRNLKGYHLTETVKPENIITVYCDYLVTKSFAAYSSGIYSDWSCILTREEGTMNWEYVDGGYA